jgi:hypothetical protein
MGYCRGEGHTIVRITTTSGKISSTEQYPQLDLSRKIITLGNTITGREMLSQIEEVAYQAAREVDAVETKSEALRRLNRDDKTETYP